MAVLGCVGGAGLRLSSLGVWPSGSFPKLQLTGVGVYERGSEEAGGAHRGDEESAGAGEGWVSAFLPLPAEASGVGWQCGESQGWRSLVGCRLWSRTESDIQHVSTSLDANTWMQISARSRAPSFWGG